MPSQESSRAGTAPDAVGGAPAAERGAGKQGLHLKKSPTLLFDILAESDKDKQQRKLKEATLTHSEQTPGQPRRSTDQQHHRHPQGPETPDQVAESAGDAGAGGSGAGSGDERDVPAGDGFASGGNALSLGLPKVSEAAVSAFTREGGGAEAGPEQQTAGGGLVGGSPTAGAGAVPDLLAEFTPRVILQELLGELFIPPERLARQGTFGQGAFATVQSCSLEDPHGGPNLLVAVKSLKPEVLADMEDLRRFLLEANLVRKLRHPNIVSIHGLGAHDLTSLEALRGSAFVVMEGLEGGDLRMMVLRQMTARTPAYSRLDALRWCLHMSAACSYLHDTCRPMVIHRDLKPENVMLTGGAIDNRVAKITDFGLHKRARYSRTEDVLIAVTNEWSTHGGSVYRGGRRAPADTSTYGGSVIDASYYGGNAFKDNASMHRGLGGSVHNRSSSAHYAALAAAGLAAATGAAEIPAGRFGYSCMPAPTAAADGSREVDADGVSGLTGGGSGGHGGSVPGDSMRAGSEAAAELGINTNGKVTERERPYLLAYDKRYDTVQGGSKFSSTTDLPALHEAAMAAAAASSALMAAGRNPSGSGGGGCQSQSSPFSAAATREPPGGDLSGRGRPGAPPCPPLMLSSHSGPLQLPTGWSPPNVVPPAGLEESVHRKILALIALETAAAAGAATATAGAGGAVPGGGGAGPSPAGAGETPFSVTEFVRAAAATVPVDGTGPSAIMLMRSMSMALQQQREQELPAAAAAPVAGIRATSAVAGINAASAPSARIARPGSTAMRTVPEDVRLSMDQGAAVGARQGGTSPGRTSAPPASAAAKRMAVAASRRERVAAAAARMADATRQVGSLIYMAPELVLSGSYNEKVDVFSFAVIAYELFTGGQRLRVPAATVAGGAQDGGGRPAAGGDAQRRGGRGGRRDGLRDAPQQRRPGGAAQLVAGGAEVPHRALLGAGPRGATQLLADPPRAEAHAAAGRPRGDGRTGPAEGDRMRMCGQLRPPPGPGRPGCTGALSADWAAVGDPKDPRDRRIGGMRPGGVAREMGQEVGRE